MKKNQPVRGLGDVVDRVTSTTGIKSAVNKVSNALWKRVRLRAAA